MAEEQAADEQTALFTEEFFRILPQTTKWAGEAYEKWGLGPRPFGGESVARIFLHNGMAWTMAFPCFVGHSENVMLAFVGTAEGDERSPRFVCVAMSAVAGIEMRDKSANEKVIGFRPNASAGTKSWVKT